MSLILSAFPDKPGLATGINACLIGMGALVFNFIGTFVINPDNHPPRAFHNDLKIFDEEVSERMPLMFEVIFFVSLAIIITCFFLIKNYPAEKEEEVEQISFRNSLNTREFWLLTISIPLTTSCPVYIVQKYKDIGLYMQVMSDHSLAILGSMGALLTAVCKVVYGHMNDLYGFKTVYLLLIFQVILVGVGFGLGVNDGWVFAVYVCINDVSLGGHYILLAPICRKLYGKIIGMKVWGILYMTVGIGTLIAFIAQVFEPNIQYFKVLILFLSGLAVLALVGLIFFRELPIYQDESSVPLLKKDSSRVLHSRD